MISISFLICTRNGAATLAECIAHIGLQTGISHDVFEVIVVDNGSTDDTKEVAHSALSALKCATKYVLEPKEGKVNAFLRGVSIAEAPLVTVVDDDNLIAEGFAFHTLQFFADFEQLGIVGSYNTIDGHDVPTWFSVAASRYGCAAPHVSGDIKAVDEYRGIASYGLIAGAGSTFRKEPLLRALELGFGFINDVRRGKLLVGGEDLELCYLLQHCGYWFGYDRRITLRHRINPKRLTWSYARRLSRSIGASGIVMDAFIFVQSDATRPLSGTWWWLAARRVRRLVNRLPAFPIHRMRYSRELLNWDVDMGALIKLCRERGAFTRKMREMKESRWAREMRDYRTKAQQHSLT